ncbi:hypothetical protein Y032_0189g1179 [Ancylostoma ceylanicum]|uniref:Uncharacterized protein n=1 Tax=Ancylostoma ceylanicum TaxID=53326 RepID=A0A016SQE3_9BILA|nr:hypothetical protein Y032_0189g1179 [Ancylostoma ceylanicum]
MAAGILLEEYSIWHRRRRGDLIFNTYRLWTVSRQYRTAHDQYVSKTKSPIRGATSRSIPAAYEAIKH